MSAAPYSREEIENRRKVASGRRLDGTICDESRLLATLDARDELLRAAMEKLGDWCFGEHWIHPCLNCLPLIQKIEAALAEQTK